jgi:hypothetical protein
MTVLAKARSNITDLLIEVSQLQSMSTDSDELAERESPAGKDVNMEAEEFALLEAIS